MARYALIDATGLVVNVITGEPENLCDKHHRPMHACPKWHPPAGLRLHETAIASAGDTYVDEFRAFACPCGLEVGDEHGSRSHAIECDRPLDEKQERRKMRIGTLDELVAEASEKVSPAFGERLRLLLGEQA